MKKFVCVLVLVGSMFASQVFALPIIGSSSGVFVNPVGNTYSGVGTSDFYWGTGMPDRSSLKFAGTSFSTNTDVDFSFGTLTYHNGTIVSGTGADAIDLSTTLNLTTPVGLQAFTYNFQLINTLNTTNPSASADYVLFPNAFPTQTFNYAGTQYTLQLTGFGNPASGGFSMINEFHVFENTTASAQLIGRVTANIPSSVPEPTLFSMLGMALFGLVAVARRKK
jgi:hypothetical protein